MPKKWKIEIAGPRTTTAFEYGEEGPVLVLAHGASGDQSSAFITRIGVALSAAGIRVVTFNFLYTEEGRRIPDKNDLLEECFWKIVKEVRTRLNAPLVFIGGKSMGGRIASHLAAEETPPGDEGRPDIAGLVFLGYPLHPPGKPDRVRAEHLAKIHVPMLFIQGSRDPFGTSDELRPVLATLQASTELVVVQEGDHSYKVPKRAPRTQAEVTTDVHAAVIAFIKQNTQ